MCLQPEGIFVEWKYVPPTAESASQRDSDWTVVDPVAYKRGSDTDSGKY